MAFYIIKDWYKQSVEIVPWSTGTDDQIKAMLEAHYNGDIDLYDYWHIGDERVINLSKMAATGVKETHKAQPSTWVLMHKGGKQLVTSINGVSTCAFIVGMKGMLNNLSNGPESGQMNQTTMTSYCWNNCDRRTWCNSVFKNAVPSGIRPIFKEHVNKHASAGKSANTTTSNDYFTLAAEKEIFGKSITANADAESTLFQYTYYSLSQDNKKKYHANGYTRWQTRSANKSFVDRYVWVESDGSTTNQSIVTGTWGLSLHSVI